MPRLSCDTLTLRQFLLRQRTLKLYRHFLATIATIEDECQRKETRDWVRQQFKANKHHTDEKVVEMHLSRAETELKQLKTMITFSGASTKQ